MPLKPRPQFANQPPRSIAPRRTVFVPIATRPAKSTAIRAGWIVLALGFLVACIPGLGFSMILLSVPFCGAAFLLGVIAAAKNRPFNGILLILSSCGAFVLYQFVPWLSTVIGAAFLPKS